MADLAPGTAFAGCRVEAVLGRGGMGVIYRATDLHLGRPVALKLIATERASDPEIRERFEREARLTASIDHPNVVPIYGAGEEDGHLYLVMRYVAGTDLHALLQREGRLDPRRAAGIVAQVAAALDAAHAAGLVHRDVKPANVLIGAGGHVYLGDFGITRVQADTRITDSGNWVGTVDYMAPEHLRGEPTDARADVYALGCVLHATLTGTPPFRRDTVPATITAQLHDPPPRPSDTPGVPAAFDGVIARALAKEPDDRYPSAGDLGAAARAAAAGEVRHELRGSVATGAATPEHAEPTRVIPVRQAHARAAATATPEDATAIAAPPEPTALAPGAGATAIAPAADATARAGADGGAPPPRAEHAPRDGHRPGDVRVQRGRRRTLALTATVLVLALPAIAVIRWATADGRPSGPLSASEVQAAAQAFADAYTREDERQLRRILTPGARRYSPTDVERSRAAIVAEYHRQFAAWDVRRYALEDLQVDGGTVGRASGTFRVTRGDGGPITGKVVFGVVRRNGYVVIDLIANEPRAT
ncbi:MAG TPA: serine/threonine-protein kinase [Baekduia sp.]|nr:serine/threonine-protein kinase [Baekduia sp.]